MKNGAETYTVGASVLYGRMGVCRVEDIGEPPFRQEKGRRYYRLRAVFSSSSECIYLPVDAKAPLRPLIDQERASDCLRRFPDLQVQVCTSRKPAEAAAHYQEVLSSCEIMDCLMVLKEINSKQKELAERNKRLSQVDVRYLKIAERLACEELAAALDDRPEAIRGRLYEAMRAS